MQPDFVSTMQLLVVRLWVESSHIPYSRWHLHCTALHCTVLLFFLGSTRCHITKTSREVNQ